MDTQQNESLTDLWSERDRLRDECEQAISNADDDRSTALQDEYWEVERRIVAADSTNPQDLAIQARLLRYYTEESSHWKDDVDHDLAAKMVAAFERMAKAGTARDALFEMDDTITTLICIASLMRDLTEDGRDQGMTWLAGHLSGAVNMIDEQWNKANAAAGQGMKTDA